MARRTSIVAIILSYIVGVTGVFACEVELMGTFDRVEDHASGQRFYIFTDPRDFSAPSQQFDSDIACELTGAPNPLYPSGSYRLCIIDVDRVGNRIYGRCSASDS